MNFKNIKNLVEKGIKGSGEKQLKVFLKNKKTSEFFDEAIKNSSKIK